MQAKVCSKKVFPLNISWFLEEEEGDGGGLGCVLLVFML